MDGWTDVWMRCDAMGTFAAGPPLAWTHASPSLASLVSLSPGWGRGVR